MKTLRLSWQQMIASVAICGLSVAMATAQGPVAHWTFDEGINDYSITTAEDSQASGGVIGTVDPSDAVWAGADTAGLTYGVGQIRGAAFLDGEDGTDHHFTINAISAIDGALGATFAGWFQPSTIGQTGQAYKGLLMTRSLEDPNGTTQNWGLAWEANGPNVDVRVSGASIDSDTTIVNDGSWYHAALVWDSDDANGALNPNKRLYINGQPTGPAVAAAGVTDIFSSGTWWIGQDENTPGTRHFRGGVDDYAIWDRVLSAGEVLALYNDGIGNGTSSTNADGVTLNDFVPGDVDGVGGVTATDYFTIRDNMNTDANGRDDGDLTGDGRVDLDDFAEWKRNAPGQVLLAAGFAVPEPSSLILLSLAALAGLGSGRRACVTRTCG